MGEISIKDWSGGLNKRFPGNRISENECQDATDLSLTNYKLSPTKGVDTGNTASGDYKFRGEWVTDADADKFVEYGTTLLKSYDSGNKLATFTRLKSSGGAATDKDIGVPPKPASPPTVSDFNTVDAESHEEALCYHSLSSSFGKAGTVADANTGGLNAINSSVNAANIHYSSSRIATFDGTYVKVWNDAWTQQGGDLEPTYKEKWWFQGDYWVGVSSTGISKVLMTGTVTAGSLVNTSLATLSYTTAAYADTAVSNTSFSTGNGYTEGWVTGTTDDYWSATSSDAEVFVSRVREGYWWTHNAPFYYGSATDTGRVQAKVRNGTSADSNGFGRTFAVIRKAGSTLKINGYADGDTVTIASVNYTVRHPKVDTATKDGFIFEWYDMHPNLTTSIGYVGARNGWAYLSSESAFKNYYIGLSDANYFIPGYFEANGEITFELSGATASDYLVVLGFTDDQATFSTVTNKSWSIDTGTGDYTDMEFTSGGSDTLMLRWDETKKRINYINRARAASSNTDKDAFNLTYPDPHQYKGQEEYLWGKLDSSLRTGVSTHNTGSVYKLRSSHLSKYTLANANLAAEFHNEDNVIEPDYVDQADGTNKNVYKNIWDWREANRALTLCGNVEGTMNDFFISATVTDSHASPSGTGTVRLSVDTIYTKSDYDNAANTSTFISNSTSKRDTETSSSVSSAYKEAESLKSFNSLRVSSANYVFFARGFTRWGEGSYIFRAVSDDTHFASALTNWSGFDLAHSHISARVDTDRIVFYNPNLDTLIPSSNTLQTRRSYGISGTVLKAKYLPTGEGNFLLYTPERNVTYVVNTATNEEAVYTLPYDEVIRYNTTDDMFYGFKWDATDERYEIYHKAYAWWFTELIDKSFKNKDTYTSGAVDLATIKHVFSVAGSVNRTKHILLQTADNTKTNWSVANYLAEIVSTYRTPQITADPEVIVAIGSVSGTTVTLTSLQDMLRVQVGDVATASPLRVVTAKTNDSLEVECTTGLSGTSFTFTRYVHKNRFWAHRADYTKIHPNLDLGETFKTGVYGSAEDTSVLDFTSHATIASIDHAAIGRSGRDIIFMGDYFYVDLDKQLVTTSSTTGLTANVMYFKVAAPTIQGEGGIAFQYKYSYLRDIAQSGEKHTDGTVMRFLLEGPPSAETPELPSALTNANSFVRLTFATADIPSDVTKVRLYRVGGNYARYALIGDLTVAGGKIGSFDDTSRTVAASTISPNEDKNPPSSSLTDITNVSGVFFGADDSRLYFSEFGNFHSWHEAAYLDFDSRITGVEEYMGEGIVFTDGQVFRVRGYNPFEMTKIVVPDVRGLPENNRRTLTKWGANVIWLGNEGVCIFSQGGVQVISNAKGEPELFDMNLPRGVVKNNVYYLLQTPEADVERKGFALDFRKGIPPCITRITQDAESIVTIPTENRVYLKNSINSASHGAFSEGTQQSVDFTSRQYDIGDVNVDKVFMNAKISYSGSGTIKFFADDETIAFAEKVLTSSSSRRLACIYPTIAKQAKQFHYTVTGGATIFEMKITGDMVLDYGSPRIFKWADVTYTGDPAISFSIDEEDTETTPALSAITSGVKTVRVSFRGGVSGFIPHYRDSSDTGEIIKVQYETEDA